MNERQIDRLAPGLGASANRRGLSGDWPPWPADWLFPPRPWRARRWAKSATRIGIASGPDDDIYVAGRFNFRIQKFRPDGTFVLAFGQQGNGDGEFASVRGGLAVDGDGNVFVADFRNDRIQKLALA